MEDANYILTLYYDSELKRPISKIEINFKANQEMTVGKNYPIKILNDSSVEEEHFKITKDPVEPKLLIMNLCLFGTYYKLKPITRTPIPYNEYIVIGKTWLHFVNEKENCLLQIINDQYEEIGRHYINYNQEISIGTSESDNIQLNDKSVSRSHLKFVAEATCAVVEDYKKGQGSTNGTWVSFKKGEMNGRIVDFRIGVETFAKLTKIESKLKVIDDKNTKKIADHAMSFYPIYFSTSEENPTFSNNGLDFKDDIKNFALQLAHNNQEKANEYLLQVKRLKVTDQFLQELAPKANIERIKLIYVLCKENKTATQNYIRSTPI